MWRFSQMKAFLFDLDGVLVESKLDLSAIKRELFGKEVPILESLDSLPVEKRLWATNRLRQLEIEASKSAKLRNGVEELLSYVEKRFRWGVVTRNCWEVVEYIRKRFSLNWDVVISRELAEPKPSPSPVLSACKLLKVEPTEVVVIGDFEYDILSGARAGARTVFLKSEKHKNSCNADIVLNDIHELLEIIKKDLSIRQREFLKLLSLEDERRMQRLSVAIDRTDEHTLVVAEQLVRMGVGRLVIAGKDSKICAVDADSCMENIGDSRKEFLRSYLLKINPMLKIELVEKLSGDYDYIVGMETEESVEKILRGEI